jgi:hypothetical protein
MNDNEFGVEWPTGVSHGIFTLQSLTMRQHAVVQTFWSPPFQCYSEVSSTFFQ